MLKKTKNWSNYTKMLIQSVMNKLMSKLFKNENNTDISFYYILILYKYNIYIYNINVYYI